MSELLIDKSSPIRKFDSAAVNAQIDKALLDLKPGEHGAAVAVADTEGMHIAYVHKVDVNSNSLEWTAMVSKPWDGPLEAQATIRYRF